jgi:hypothetical protein
MRIVSSINQEGGKNVNEFTKELAARLNGRQYLCEINKEDETFAKEHGLVNIYIITGGNYHENLHML